MKEIQLSQGKVAIIDDEDYEIVSQYKWFYNERYAKTTIHYKKVYLHKFIINPPAGYLVDHKDGNTLNNTRNNLRICTHVGNCQNRPGKTNSTSTYKGVSLFRSKKKIKDKVYTYQAWQAHIMVNGKAISLGKHKNEIDAAIAYNEAAKKHHGEFAKLNLI